MINLGSKKVIEKTKLNGLGGSSNSNTYMGTRYKVEALCGSSGLDIAFNSE